MPWGESRRPFPSATATSRATAPPGENRVQLFASDPCLAWLLRSEQAYLTLPDDATERLRDLVERSADYLLDAIREGISQGDIRNDIEPEDLLVLVMGTIHALVGMPGVHRRGASRRRRDSDRVLLALERMLAPPESRTE